MLLENIATHSAPSEHRRQFRILVNDLLTLPPNAGRAIVEAAALRACPLLGTDRFVSYCKDRGYSVSRNRLHLFETLRLFAPVFRVRSPRHEDAYFRIPVDPANNWFDNGFAFDTTGVMLDYQVPSFDDSTQEGYYSIFQIHHLDVVLSAFSLNLHLEDLLDNAGDIDWNTKAAQWADFARQRADSLRTDEYRRSIALLCQFISDRYFAPTQSDQRTIRTGLTTYSDQWISVHDPLREWHDVVKSWNPIVVQDLFNLTLDKLRHAYEGLAVSQEYNDPIANWYQLVQFISVDNRERLKELALRAETLRAGASMLRLLFRDLYGQELPHPNEVTGQIFTHMPELDVRKDKRRYLEFVVNRFGLNPQPKLCLILEGPSEEAAVHLICEKYFGNHPGTFGIEMLVLGGVDVATGGKDDRFRAILRLIDYLHHHQTFTFLVLDNERYVRKLKHAIQTAKSIHHHSRYVTRPEYLKVWRQSFEFDNFSDTELAAALNTLVPKHAPIQRADVARCRIDSSPGAALKRMHQDRRGAGFNKVTLAVTLTEGMLQKSCRRNAATRPIVKVLERVVSLAVKNPFPVMRELWERNQASKYLGKKRG